MIYTRSVKWTNFDGAGGSWSVQAETPEKAMMLALAASIRDGWTPPKWWQWWRWGDTRLPEWWDNSMLDLNRK